MEHLSNVHEDHPNQHENSHKLCNEIGHPLFSLTEVQWKLRQQRDQNFSMVESHYRTNASISWKKKIQKSSTVRVRGQDSSRKVNHQSKVVWSSKIITVYNFYPFHQNRLASWVDLQTLIYVRWNSIKSFA